jgi:hypothetical protein
MGVGGQCHASTALPRQRPSTHCIGGWLGPRAGLDGCGKSHPHRDSIPGPSSMRTARWVPEPTDIHSEYIILIAFPQQQWLHESASVLRYTYITFVLRSFKFILQRLLTTLLKI